MSACLDERSVTNPIEVCDPTRRVNRWAIRAAIETGSILIKGCSGTGKKTLARHIHRLSPRAAAPFVVLHGLDCSTEDLAEAAERAEGGTLLLDQLGECPLETQARIVKRLQSARTYRFIATGPADLAAQVAAGRLRQDLYFLIGELSYCLPPLRERVEEILPIAVRVLSSLHHDGPTPVLSSAAIERLRAHAWPGNIRELVSVIRRASLLTSARLIDDKAIELDQFAQPTEGSSLKPEPAVTIDGRSAFARQRDQAERSILLAALRDGRGSRTDIAQRLGISPRTLRYKLARLRAAGMEVPA